MGNTGDRIRLIRQNRKITQETLSENAGVNRSLISKIEKGKSVGSVHTLTKIAAALGVSITEILSDQSAGTERQASIENGGGARMTMVWYVCDGQVEEYSGQEANWNNSVIVCADSPEDALIKVLQYYGRRLECSEVIHDGNIIMAIA